MIEDNYTIIKKDLCKIADMLLLNGTLTTCPGLICGKMGIAIFFFHYAQYTGNVLFADYAMSLIEKIQNQIHTNSPTDYRKGLAGIGLGVNYLIQNNFLDVESDVFEDLDRKITQTMVNGDWSDYSKYDGLIGYGRYWISRLQYKIPSTQARECLFYITELIDRKLSKIPVEEQADVYSFLYDLPKKSNFGNSIDLLERCKVLVDINKSFSHLGNSAIGRIAHQYQCSKYLNNALFKKNVLTFKQVPKMNMEESPIAMGILSGYAGEGMLRLTALQQINNSWIYLL